MKISIITVCFNSQATILETLHSVKAQNYKNYEHIIIDGGSSDDTVSICKSFGGLIIVSERDNGIYDAMNKGVKLSSGEIVGFLNSDDIFYRADALSDIALAFQDPNIDACYSDLIYFSKDSNINCGRYWDSSNCNNSNLKYGQIPPHPTFYVRRYLFDEYGFFDTKYKIAADFLFMINLMMKNKILSFYINRPLVQMRTGGASDEGILSRLKQNIEIYKGIKEYRLPIFYPLFIINRLLIRLLQLNSNIRNPPA